MLRRLEYLLDTDTCIYLLKGHQKVKDKVAQAGVEALSVAIVTVGELYFGAYNSARVDANLEKVRAFVSPPGPTILAIDDAAVECFGRFKAELRRAGTPIGDVDLLIAGVAASRGLTVITNNIAHFQRVPGISLETWLAPLDQSP